LEWQGQRTDKWEKKVNRVSLKGEERERGGAKGVGDWGRKEDKGGGGVEGRRRGKMEKRGEGGGGMGIR